MNQPKKKKTYYQKVDFQDEEVYNEIKDQIREIQQKGLKQVEQEMQINELYRTKKQQKNLKLRMQKSGRAYNNIHDNKNDIQSQSDQPGQINEQHINKKRQLEKDTQQKQISVHLLYEHIKAITLTRDKIILCLDNRKFQQLVKGCFVRYLSDQKKSKDNSYVIAQVIGVMKSDKYYTLKEGSRMTNILLQLQQTSEKIVKLQLNMISNKAPSGTLQFTSWIQVNRSKMLKQADLKKKLEQYNKLLSEQLSSHQIDKNIYKKATAIANGKISINQDIHHLIDFMHQRLDNFEALLQLETAKNKQQNLQLMKIKRQVRQSKQVLDKLILLNKKNLEKQELLKKQMMQQKRQRKKSIKFQYKRTDEINQKSKLKELLLGTYEGFQKVKNKLLDNHLKFDIEI